MNKFPCPVCGKRFKSALGCRIHAYRQHTSDGKKHTDRLRRSNAARPPRKRVVRPLVTKKRYPNIAPVVIFCPRCGCNIRNVEVAVRLGG